MEGLTLGAVIASLIAGVIIILVPSIRQKASLLPSKFRELKRNRAQAKSNAETDELRDQVHSRSKQLGIDLPWSIDYGWKGPGVRIIYRSEADAFFIDAYDHGIGQYRNALQRGLVPPERTFASRPPKCVKQWTKTELRDWLRNNSEEEEGLP